MNTQKARGVIESLKIALNCISGRGWPDDEIGTCAAEQTAFTSVSKCSSASISTNFVRPGERYDDVDIIRFLLKQPLNFAFFSQLANKICVFIIIKARNSDNLE